MQELKGKKRGRETLSSAVNLQWFPLQPAGCNSDQFLHGRKACNKLALIHFFPSIPPNGKKGESSLLCGSGSGPFLDTEISAQSLQCLDFLSHQFKGSRKWEKSIFFIFFLPDLLSISLQYTKCTATLSSSESKEILQSGNFISNPAQLWAWLPSLLPTHQQLFNAIPHLMQAPLQDYNCINKRVHMFSVFPPPPIYFSPSIHSFSFLFFQVLCTVSDT